MSDSSDTRSALHSALPSGWTLAKFDDTCEPVTNGGRKVPQKDYLKSGQFPIVDQGEELIGGFTDDPAMLFQGKTPVIAFGDHTRRFKLIDWPFVVGADGIKLIAPSDVWDVKCLWFFLCALKFEDRGYSRHFQFLRKSLLPLPPKTEQVRIADAVDEVLSELDAGVAALERVREKLKLYRAAVLKAAVEGALTAEWRKQHPYAEPASALLQRILIERRRRWEEEQLRKFKEKGKEPPPNWKAKYKEPVAPDITNLSPLPGGWCWASLDQLCTIQSGLTKSPTRKPTNNHFPYLRVANVHRGALDLSELHRFELTAEELDRLRLQPGDLLIVEGNGSRTEIGRCAMWAGEVTDCVHQNHIIRARSLPGLLPKFANLFMNSPTGQSAIQWVASSTSGLYTLSVGKIQRLPLALAPTDEQEAIVEAVEDQLSVIDHLETEFDIKLKSAQGLRQSILRHAFTGQLVPQDPNDEPASGLLKRIAVEREARAREAAVQRANKKNIGPRTAHRGRPKKNQTKDS